MADIDLRDALDAAIAAVDSHEPKLHASVAALSVALQAAAPLLIKQGRRQAAAAIRASVRDALGLPRGVHPDVVDLMERAARIAETLREPAPAPPCGCRCVACGGDFPGHCVHQGAHPLVPLPWTPDQQEAVRRLAAVMRKEIT